MADTLSEFLAHHPVDRENVERHKQKMLAEVRAYQLKELRSNAGSLSRNSPTESAFHNAKSPRLNMETLRTPGSALLGAAWKQLAET